jgi:hypothetical protein
VHRHGVILSGVHELDIERDGDLFADENATSSQAGQSTSEWTGSMFQAVAAVCGIALCSCSFPCRSIFCASHQHLIRYNEKRFNNY